jgi:hypothetical protein
VRSTCRSGSTRAANLSKVTFFIGNWNSVQSKKTLATGSGPGNWYESDIYTGFKFLLFDTIAFKPYYIAYTYPGGAFNTVQEMDLGVALNDAQCLDKFESPPSACWVAHLRLAAHSMPWRPCSRTPPSG